MQKLTPGTISGWVSAALLAGAGYWYLQDSNRNSDDLHEKAREILAKVETSFAEEAARDTDWLREENEAFESVRELVRQVAQRQDEIIRVLATHTESLGSATERLKGLEAGHADLHDFISTANDDFSYRLGLHKGDHRFLENLIGGIWRRTTESATLPPTSPLFFDSS